MKRLPLAVFAAGFVLFSAAETWFLGGGEHGEFWWSHVYGFFSILGFVGCLAIVLMAKFILGPRLQRREGYYGRNKRS